MASNLFDWLFRLVMLVLAGMVTLSILGSIAAISPDARVPGFSVEQPRPPVRPDQEQEARPPEPRPEPTPREGAPQAEPGGQVATVAPAPEPGPDSEDWLEAIAYALLALCGLAAIGLLLLWKAVRQLRRIADEPAFSARPRS